MTYGENCMSRSQVYEWVEKFRNGVTCLEDAPRPGHPASFVNPDMVEGGSC
jgi:transposase